MILEALLGFGVALVATIIYHEVGHLVEAKSRGYHAEFKGFSVIVFPNPSRVDDLRISISGVLWGLAPVFLYSFVSSTGFYVLFVVYLLGCRSDLANIFGNGHG
jgi:hypothetical protein